MVAGARTPAHSLYMNLNEDGSFTGPLAPAPTLRPGPCPGTPLVGAFPPLGPQGLINASARCHAAGGARAFDLDIALLARCTIVADQGVAVFVVLAHRLRLVWVVAGVVLAIPLVADGLGLGAARPEEQRFLDPSTLHLPGLVVLARLEEMVHLEVLVIVERHALGAQEDHGVEKGSVESRLRV